MISARMMLSKKLAIWPGSTCSETTNADAPNQFVNDDSVAPPISGWVVNVLHTKPLYGVVRYFPFADNPAWVESETSFADEAWVRETIRRLSRTPSECPLKA